MGRPPGPRPPCGTDQGYQYHLRHCERTCGPCRQAHTASQLKRRERLEVCQDCGQERPVWARFRCVTCYGRWRG